MPRGCRDAGHDILFAESYFSLSYVKYENEQQLDVRSPGFKTQLYSLPKCMTWKCCEPSSVIASLSEEGGFHIESFIMAAQSTISDEENTIVELVIGPRMSYLPYFSYL